VADRHVPGFAIRYRVRALLLGDGLADLLAPE
jgi:hypothetical protein